MNRTSVIVVLVACSALYLLWGPVPGAVEQTRSVEPIASQRFGILGYSTSERYAGWNQVQFTSGPVPRTAPRPTPDEVVDTWDEGLFRLTALLTILLISTTIFALWLIDRRERTRTQPLA